MFAKNSSASVQTNVNLGNRVGDYGDEGPFAMMVGFPGPHCPYDPDPEFLKDFDPADMPEPVPEIAGATPEIRRQNIEGNKKPWNGVDYSEFTLAQKKKVRAHYAALVKQIDYEVGQILDTLRDKDLLENTIIIFSSDHGDYLGDHNLIGKGHFFESGIPVPLLVRLPWAEGTAVNQDLVALSDVTATMLSFAGCEVPPHMDSVPLPGLGNDGHSPRESMIGTLAGGWMIYDGVWRLSKYGTGEALLFNLQQDPLEQQDLMRDPGSASELRRLDAELTRALMRSMDTSFFDRRVYVQSLSQEPWFGREGWRRPYPNSTAL